jgi:hypothetical protein
MVGVSECLHYAPPVIKRHKLSLHGWILVSQVVMSTNYSLVSFSFNAQYRTLMPRMHTVEGGFTLGYGSEKLEVHNTPQ